MQLSLALSISLNSHADTGWLQSTHSASHPHCAATWFQIQSLSTCFIFIVVSVPRPTVCHFRASSATRAGGEWRHDAGGVRWIHSRTQRFYQGHQEGFQQWEESECDIIVFSRSQEPGAIYANTLKTHTQSRENLFCVVTLTDHTMWFCISVTWAPSSI